MYNINVLQCIWCHWSLYRNSKYSRHIRQSDPLPGPLQPLGAAGRTVLGACCMTESYWPCWVLLALAWPFGAIWCDGNAKDSETHRHPSFFPKHPGLGKCWKFAPELQFRRSRRSPQKNTHRWSHRHVQIWAVPVSSPQTSSTAWSRIVSCSAPPCETLGKEWDAVMICATFLVYYQRINERV